MPVIPNDKNNEHYTQQAVVSADRNYRQFDGPSFSRAVECFAMADDNGLSLMDKDEAAHVALLALIKAKINHIPGLEYRYFINSSTGKLKYPIFRLNSVASANILHPQDSFNNNFSEMLKCIDTLELLTFKTINIDPVVLINAVVLQVRHKNREYALKSFVSVHANNPYLCVHDVNGKNVCEAPFLVVVADIVDGLISL